MRFLLWRFFFFGQSGYFSSPEPVTAGPATKAGQLDHGVTYDEPVVPFSTGRFLSVFTPLVFVPVFIVSPVAPMALLSDGAPDFALDVQPSSGAPHVALDVAPSSSSFRVALDVAPVTMPLTTSSALPPPIPALPAFLSSPLALLVFVPRSLSTPASAFVPGVALLHIRTRLDRRDIEPTDLKDCLVAWEADVERLMAEVESLNEQVTALRGQDAQRAGHSPSRSGRPTAATFGPKR